MSRNDELLNDPAFRQAVEGARSALMLLATHQSDEPDAACQLVAVCVLTAFANADGLSEPHAGILARFAPDLGGEATRQ